MTPSSGLSDDQALMLAYSTRTPARLPPSTARMTRTRKTRSHVRAPAPYRFDMPVVGSRTRDLPAPPSVVFGDLVAPNRQPTRPWLLLLDDEVPPRVLRTDEFTYVSWSSLWIRRPDAVLEIELAERRGGTSLHWTLTTDDPVPDDSLTGHLRKRTNHVFFADLRFSYGA